MKPKPVWKKLVFAPGRTTTIQLTMAYRFTGIKKIYRNLYREGQAHIPALQVNQSIDGAFICVTHYNTNCFIVRKLNFFSNFILLLLGSSHFFYKIYFVFTIGCSVFSENIMKPFSRGAAIR